MYSVTKEFSFDSAHRLVNGYQGKCSNIHGHTWKVRFTVAGNKLNEYGFVRDFSDFKPLKQWIDENLDHAMILHGGDDAMLRFCVEHRQKHFVMAANPTSENLARFLYGRASFLGIPVTAVEIDETCTCSARYAP